MEQCASFRTAKFAIRPMCNSIDNGLARNLLKCCGETVGKMHYGMAGISLVFFIFVLTPSGRGNWPL